jgi:4-diphosphocytidyl-2-C-methyl-D-erythritol kinase
LEVLGRHTDGFHQVETLLVPVRRFDTLVYSPSAAALSFTIRGARNYPFGSLAQRPDENLAVRAIQRLAEHSGRPATGRLILFKRIPTQAGLGGGSSDAAAALVAANAAWGLNYSRDQLAAIAVGLGTDVPFFLHRGAALGTNRGDQLTPVSLPCGLPMVLVQPPVGLATAKVFAALGLEAGEPLSTGTSRCTRLVERLLQGTPIQRCRDLIKNCLQPPATEICDWIQRVAEAVGRFPVLAHQMTGSGSCYFAVCRTWREAQRMASQLRGRPWQFVVATQTCL